MQLLLQKKQFGESMKSEEERYSQQRGKLRANDNGERTKRRVHLVDHEDEDDNETLS